MKVDITNLTLWALLMTAVLSTTKAQECTDGDVRLQGGPNEFEGQVEICDGAQWTTLCYDSNLQLEERRVVCRQLGFDTSQEPRIASSEDFFFPGRSNFTTLQCDSGAELNVSACVYSTSNTCSGGAILLCGDPECFMISLTDGMTRLVNGTTANEGRVETCLSNGFWRPACIGNWDEVDARVVCRQLGLDSQEVTAVTGDRFGRVRYMNTAYQNVTCFGNESRLVDCPRVNSGGSLCSYAGVICGENPFTSPTEPSPTTDMQTATATTQTAPTNTSRETEPSTTGPQTVPPTGSSEPPSSVITPDNVTASMMSIMSLVPTVSSMPLTPTDDTSTTVASTKDPQTVVLLASLLGAFGGVILLLLCVIMLIFTVVRRRNRKYGIQSRKSTPCLELHSATYMVSPTNGSSKVTIDNAVYANSMRTKREDSEPERVLLNPLYSLSKKHGDNKTERQPYYSEISISSSENQQKPVDKVYYSVIPMDRQYATLESPTMDETSETIVTETDIAPQPVTSVYYSTVPPESQYTTFESPVEETSETATKITALPTGYFQPYEIPMIQPYESSAIMKGTLASSNDSLDLLTSETSTMVSIPKPHILQSGVAHQEYDMQQDTSFPLNPPHHYDSPKMVSKSPNTLHRGNSTSQGETDTTVMTTHVYDTPRMSRKARSTKGDQDYDEPEDERDYDEPKDERDYDEPKDERDYDEPEDERDYDEPA